MLYELLDFSDGQFPAGLGWHDKIVEGFPQSALWCLSRHLGVEAANTATLVGLAETELSWRKRSAVLSTAISDKLFQVARAYQRLMVPLKDEEQVKLWLRTAQPTLNNQIPVILLMSQAGAQEVLATIDAIKPIKSVEMNPVFDEASEDEGDGRNAEASDDYPAEIA